MKTLTPLPPLNQYSESEYKEASRLCPVVGHYLNICHSLRSPAKPDFGQMLRAQRHRLWLEAALASIFDKTSTQDVCSFWSQAADSLISQTWQHCGLDQEPLGLFALGKLGAEELNLSSDVDLVILALDPKSVLNSEKKFRLFRKILQTNTEMGYCLRLDFDLRPGGNFGPLIPTIKQFEDYYWSQGETWERLALVRLRPLVGQSEVLSSIQELAHKFSYRKYLDYTLLEDLKNLRSQSHKYYQSLRGSTSQDIHLKLDLGGIRDIELFIHSLQILHGGKNPKLRTHSTALAIERIQEEHLLPTQDIDFLRTSYWYYRTLENKVQVYQDQQTHSLKPKTFPHLTADELKSLRDRQSHVDNMVSGLLGKVDLSLHKLPSTLAQQQDWLKGLGFADKTIATVWPQLIESSALSHRRDRDERARRGFLFAFVEELCRTQGDKDLALNLLIDFLKATRAKATLFSLFLHHQALLKDMAVLFASSPYLGGLISSRPELVDSFVYRSLESEATDLPSLLEELTEQKLLTEIIAASQFLSEPNIHLLTRILSESADEICLKLLSALSQEYGSHNLCLLALGKWGGMELGFRSDLDFVFVAKTAPQEADYKIAKRFISRLTEAHRGGRIYSVDLRLRPSGTAGPLLVTQDTLLDYLKNKALAWERQSYLRARWVQPYEPTFPLSVLTNKGLSQEDCNELKDIRSKLIIPPTNSVQIDLKLSSGGLTDIELATQTTVLYKKLHLDSGNTFNMFSQLSKHEATWQNMAQNYLFLRQVEQAYQLASRTSGSRIDLSSQNFLRAAQLLRSPKDSLGQKVLETLSDSADKLKALDPIFSPY